MIPAAEKIYKAKPELKKELGVSNDWALPRLKKVVISVGVGRKRDKKTLELVADRLAKITGQKPSPRPAKKSIASFKLRAGETIGFIVTLRGARMQAFLDKLINVAVPRTRDFRGFDPKAVDDGGNLTIAVREHTVFPETSDEDLKDVFGFAVTVVTTAGTRRKGEQARERALKFFHALGFPFKK